MVVLRKTVSASPIIVQVWQAARPQPLHAHMERSSGETGEVMIMLFESTTATPLHYFKGHKSFAS